MTGSVIDRGDGKFLLKWDAPRKPGEKRRQLYRVVRAEGVKEAKKLLRAEIGKIDRGEYVAPNKLTIGDCVDRWLTHEETKSKPPSGKTLETYRDLCRLHIRPGIGAKVAQALTASDLVAFYGTLRAEPIGLGPRTICHAHRLVFAILSRAVTDKRLSKNVAGEIAREDRPKAPDDEVEILDEAQTAAVLDALRGKALYPLVAVAVSTGIRRGELLALRWNDVDFDRGTIRVDESIEQTKAGLRVKAPKTKSGRRIIAIPPTLAAELRAVWKATAEKRLALGMGSVPADSFVFGHIDTGAARAPSTLTREWARAVEKIKGVPAVTWHALRHTHASQLLRSGVDIVTVSRRLGHSKADITLRVYSHLMPGADAAAAAIMEKALNGALGTR